MRYVFLTQKASFLSKDLWLSVLSLLMFLIFLFFSLLGSRELFVIPVEDIVERCGERGPHKVGNDEIAGDMIDVVECDPKCRRAAQQRYTFVESPFNVATPEEERRPRPVEGKIKTVHAERYGRLLQATSVSPHQVRRVAHCTVNGGPYRPEHPVRRNNLRFFQRLVPAHIPLRDVAADPAADVRADCRRK